MHQLPQGKGSPADGQPRSVRLWDAKTGAALQRLSGHVGSIHALVYTPDGTRLISAGADQVIRIWDLANGRLARSLEGHSAPVHALAIDPHGRLLASAGAEGMIRIWDLGEGTLLRSLTGHANWVMSLAFHPDGTRLASAGADRTVRLWDPRGGREVLTLHGHQGRVNGVAFSGDGSRLASVSEDGLVRVWETDLTQQCASAPEPLTSHSPRLDRSRVTTARPRASGEDLATVWTRISGFIQGQPTQGLESARICRVSSRNKRMQMYRTTEVTENTEIRDRPPWRSLVRSIRATQGQVSDEFRWPPR